MIYLKDVVRFKKELYFNGAVQVDWYYNKEKQEEVAKSFVFHGPEYFGVFEDDLTYKTHRLVDTATFANILANKLYGDSSLSNFFMVIAPYGTGKSHLALTLASLFSGNASTQKDIISNIEKVDGRIGKEIKKYSLKPNLVLVLNGMRDFNLNYEILNATQKVLDLQGVDGGFLKSITKSYDIAKNFVNNTYENYENLYKEYAQEILSVADYVNLKNYLLENILQDPNVFEVINKVYYQINGTYIRWDEGISAGDVLSKIAEHLCGDRGKFNKVLVFFDEFGRYIEFASAYPTRAGDSALQQIYEAVQDSSDKIVFVGFIQSDLKSYLTRVDRTANISRYIGRYEASEKIHLSSNLETIFANLIERKDSNEFKRLVVNKIEKNKDEWKLFHEKFLAWSPHSKNSSVWGDFEHFRKIVLEGAYPLHPLTTWMLSNLSSWLQQRSSLTFLERQIDLEANNILSEFGDLSTVPATRIIRSEFFKELLAAEQEGRKQSEYCILYNQILIKHGDKLDERQKEVLAANLVARIGKFKTRSLEETKQLLAYIAQLTFKEVNEIVTQLEHELGVISYDESANVFDFIADATGINDFKRLINEKRRKLELNLSLFFDNAVQQVLPLEVTDTSFGIKNNITTNEWKFSQQIVHIGDVGKEFLLRLKDDWELSTSPEKPKGKLVWLYVPAGTDTEEIEKVSKLLKRFEFDKIPIVFFVLDDQNSDFYNSLVEYQISNLFTEQEKAKFYRFIPEFREKTENLVRDRFNELMSKRTILTGDGVSRVDKRPKLYFEALFDELYPNVIPFSFTEFTNKSLGKAKRNLSRIGRLILSGATFQIIHSETTEIRNRIEGMLFEGRTGSWGIFNSDYQVISPTNLKIRQIYGEIDELVVQSEEVEVSKIFDVYQKPPYGINDYALALLIATYLMQRKLEIRVSIGNVRLRLEEWGNEVFADKEVDFKKLFDTTVIKVDPEKSAGRYLVLYNKVEKNNDIDMCPSLWAEYQKLKQEEDIPKELEDKIINMELILKEGLKLHKNNTELFGSLRSKLEDGKRGKQFRLIFEVLDECQNIQGMIGDSTRYLYNQKHLEEARQMELTCHSFIQEEFEHFINSLKCQSYAQVSAFEKWVLHLIDSLTKYDYRDLARKLRTKLDKILDDLTIIQKLQNINETVQNYLNNNKPSPTSGYNELMKIKNDGQEILKLLEKYPVDKSYLHEYYQKIESNINKADEYLNKLKEEVSEVYDVIYNLLSVQDCKEFLSQVRTVLGKSISDIDREGIEQAANDVQNFLNDVYNLEKFSDNRKELINELNALQDKWGGYESEVDFSLIIDAHEKYLLNRLNDLEERWKQNYLSSLADEVPNWDVSRCMTWLENTNIIPPYLSESTIYSLKEAREFVNNRLSDLQVEAVISLFSKLSDEQKEIALLKMKNMLNVIS